MRNLIRNDSFIREAKEARRKPNIILQMLIFLVVFFVSQYTVSFIVSIFVIANVVMNVPPNFNFGDFRAIADLLTTAFESRGVIIVSLFATVAATISVIVYCKSIEGRSLKSMGFVKKNAVKQYFYGLLIGFLMFSICVGICLATGTLIYSGIIIGGNITFIILFFFGFLLQGMSEEVLMRGYFMTSLSNKVPIVVAIMINSVVFACLHLLNSGISVLAFTNLILFGVFASVYAIKTNNLWGICAIHSMWNFTQGNFFGILVSGQNTNASIFKFTSTSDGILINGGDFGLEGGLAVTIVLVLATVNVLFVYTNKTPDILEVI